MTKKLLSIIIPTYNRAEFLLYTLSHFREQIIRNAKEVELIVCNNVSTDNTHSVLHSYHADNPFFLIREYESHVEGGDAVVRPTENADGEYFMLFGDDDVPAPFMVDLLLNSIKKYPQAGEFLVNRLVGRRSEDSLALEAVYLIGTTDYSSGEVYYDNFSAFIEEHHHEIGFTPTHVVNNNLWRKYYRDVYPNADLGFEQIAPIMYSIKNAPIVYLQYPLCIQGRPSLSNKRAAHDFQGVTAFLYYKVGRFRAIKHLWKLGIVKDLRSACDNYIYQKNAVFPISMLDNRKSFLYACVNWPDDIAPYADEICDYQSDEGLKIMIRRLLLSKHQVQSFWRIYYATKLQGRRWLLKYICAKITKIGK